jgi:hypothetical protein
VRHLGRSGARGGHASRMSREGFAELLKILQFLSEFSLVAFLTNKIWKRKSAIIKEDNQLNMWILALFALNLGNGLNFWNIFWTHFVYNKKFLCFMIFEKIKSQK